MRQAIAVHTTNYFDSFIEVADDCKALMGIVPDLKNGKKTIAYRQFERIAKNPYAYTSDDILFQLFAEKNDVTENEYKTARALFFSKGQPCFRASPLTKQFGWGIHFDSDGKIALYGIETQQYQHFIDDSNLKKVKAMRTSRK